MPPTAPTEEAKAIAKALQPVFDDFVAKRAALEAARVKHDEASSAARSASTELAQAREEFRKAREQLVARTEMVES